jgi:hypothetical protein
VLALILDAVVVIASLVWAGGLLALGAIAAPIVFRSGNPEAATLMMSIFVRFDRVAVAAAAALLAAEAISLLTRRPMRRADRVTRVGLALVLAACAGLQAWYLSPAITGMYQQGVRRNVGAAGARFERVHRASERTSKATAFAALALAVFVLRSRGRSESDDAPVD